MNKLKHVLIYREEGLPLGPTWDEVGRMLANTAGNGPGQVRDHAILRLNRRQIHFRSFLGPPWEDVVWESHAPRQL